jgi:hypothetical protein
MLLFCHGIEVDNRLWLSDTNSVNNSSMHLYTLLTGIKPLKLVFNVNNFEKKIFFPISKRKHGVSIRVKAG